MIIGLTGNIGSGKSKAAAYLASKGAYIINADKISREVVMPGMPAYQKIRKVFGEEYFFSNGSLDRKKLGNLVFNDPTALKKLNAITHPAIVNRCRSLADDYLRKNPNGIVVIEAALFVETDMLEMVDSLWLLVCDRKLRLERIIDRDKLTMSEAIARMESQMSEERKKAYADHIVDNNNDEKALFANLDKLWENTILNKE